MRIDRRDVDVGEHGPDFRSLAYITLAELQRLEREIEDGEFDGHRYVNPQWTVTASAQVPEREFLKHAEWACIEWIKAIDRTIGPSSRKRRVKAADDGGRRLIFGGILFLSSRPVHAKRLNWRANGRAHAPR